MGNRLPSAFQARRSWTVTDIARASLHECTALASLASVPAGASYPGGQKEEALARNGEAASRLLQPNARASRATLAPDAVGGNLDRVNGGRPKGPPVRP